MQLGQKGKGHPDQDKRTNMIDVIEDYDEDDDHSYDEGDADADDFVEDNEIMRAMKILMILR